MFVIQKGQFIGGKLVKFMICCTPYHYLKVIMLPAECCMYR